MKRGVSPAAVIGVLAIVVSLSGTAVATSRGGLTLGTTNKATKTTTLKDSHGTPLALTAGKGKPPLSVSGNETEVPSLNASLLDGLTASALIGQVHIYAKPATTGVHVPVTAHLALFTVVGGGGGGGGGGTGPGGSGGQGAYASAYVPVTPGEALQVTVGKPGPGGAADGDGGDVGGDSGVSYGAGFTSSYLAARGGGGGFQGNACNTVADGGSSGVALGPRPVPTSDPEDDLTLVDGTTGSIGHWLESIDPGDCDGFPGTGPGAGYAGFGGNGGATAASGASTAGADGGSGLVTVEYFR